MNNYNKKIPKTRRVKALVVLASRYGKKSGSIQHSGLIIKSR